MPFSESFLVTGLPAGINGDELLLDVLVSPRLGSDGTGKAALSNWPDVEDWPDARPTWTVTIKQGTQTVTIDASELIPDGGYDADAWAALFPSDQLQKPYKPVDQSDVPILSYPAAAVRDAVRDLHVATLKNSRNEFPLVTDLRNDDVFGCLMEAADPATEAAVLDQQLEGPVADADVECHQAFAMSSIIHGVRPGSEPGTVIFSLDPSTVRTFIGTPIVMKGRLFDAVTSLYVEDPNGPNTGLPFTHVSNTEIHFTSPSLNTPGPKKVHILTADGEADTATLTYVLPPPPSITSVTPVSYNNFIPGGKVVTVTGQFLAGSTAARLTKATDASFSVPLDPPNNINETTVTIFVPQSVTANLYDIRITTPLGETAPTLGDRFNVFNDNGVH